MTFIALMFSALANAQLNGSNMEDLFSDEPSFLPVDEAFVFDFAQQGDVLVIRFEIADGYYLYKKQFKASTKNATLGEPVFPPAEQIEDEFFGISDVYYNTVSFSYPIIETIQDGVVKLRYQGCALAGLCYPPTTKVIYLNSLKGSTVTGQLSGGELVAKATDDSAIAQNNSTVSEQYDLANMLQSDGNLLLTLLLFLALGIGLAFTPCVFPMYPIVSGIVIGQGKDIKLSRAFTLAFVYVQGMAIMYSLLGLVVASAGVQFQASLQSPYILGTFIVVFVALAAAMFGAYEIQLPSSWQEKVSGMSNAQQRGSLVGVFVMGILSGLIASPCTTAPLTGVLIFIAQSGDMTLGFLALYALSLGMGIPLIIFAMTGGKLLPKAGNWMNIIKTTFGFMLLSVAIIFIERLWNSDYTWLLWSALGLATFSYYQVANQSTAATFAKGVRSLLIFVGLFISAMIGYNTLFSHNSATGITNATNAGVSTPAVAHPQFMVVKNLADFEQKLAAANAEGKSVMVDLYADWCVACKEFEKYTFVDPEVIDALSNTVWMQIDLTDNTPTNLAFQEAFNVLGLPTILLFDEQGQELTKARVTGFMKAQPFARHVKNALTKNQ
ncbi:protein-disulfide reductase DsbD [Alteromonas lipolytica]|uniref:Thiol:disulfide interchange protein DsbD n=1 Tax=Alteromonas lipolytica TaxID=1856405 RepID=A0A1E8FIF8_9ALTE|nr:protein-disulfide reductase DsbD [Alteromonas lipolytica]OFI35699.1 protein-disulfide reductase DsbD [Alteromonas lipolytica]